MRVCYLLRLQCSTLLNWQSESQGGHTEQREAIKREVGAQDLGVYTDRLLRGWPTTTRVCPACSEVLKTLAVMVVAHGKGAAMTHLTEAGPNGVCTCSSKVGPCLEWSSKTDFIKAISPLKMGFINAVFQEYRFSEKAQLSFSCRRPQVKAHSIQKEGTQIQIRV